MTESVEAVTTPEAPVPPRRRRVLTIPNMISVGRLGLIPFFVAAALTGRHTLAFTLFVTAGISDIFDGWIARRFNQKSSIGAVLDPAADKIMMFSAYIIYTVDGSIGHRLPLWLTVTIFMRDLMITVFAYLLYTRIRVRRFPPSFAGKTSTVIQIVTLAAVMAANGALAPVGLALLPPFSLLALGMTLFSGLGYMRRARLMLDDHLAAA
ncbi:MAG: CDP-alcohol phosphatidyltransferase family protein [Thermoanaerobaculia bacterium]|nr:CDP-alcohol phosphatidyltransferase family protein [Thermoanaerobaculia bacterium]